MDILRFITAGNVDDGKSTLIGRLLYDTGNIKADVLQSVSGADRESINLAHITDGLRAEREQGITIDVAYKYFTTKTRKYIITDAPGHFQYTRNLVTGASSVDAIIILIDARNGITEQTRRHSLVAAFLNIHHVVVAINKMDTVGYDESIFTIIRNEYLEIAEKLQISNIEFIPISALVGDNVSATSENMQWYKGETLLQYLENCRPHFVNNNATRFSVQYVLGDIDKGYAGKVLSGEFKVGDIAAVFPAKQQVMIAKIVHGYTEIQAAQSGQNVILYFFGNSDVSRGDIISYYHRSPICNNHFEATICWLYAERPLKIGAEYSLRIGCKEVACTIRDVIYKTDVHTFDKYNDDAAIEVNQFARVKIETKDMIAYDEYEFLAETGRGIIIDKETNYTVGAFVI